MDFSNVDLCHLGRGELVDLVIKLRAENARLHSVIDEDNAQEPAQWNRYDSDKFVGTVYKLPSGMYDKNSRYEPLYKRPIPARQSVDRQTIIDILVASGNLSEGVTADIIISAIGAQQSPAVCISKMESATTSPAVAVPDSRDREMLVTLMSAFDTEHTICAQCGNQEETMYMDSANMLRNYLADNSIKFSVQSPRITEQDARLATIKADSVREFCKEIGLFDPEYADNGYIEVSRHSLKEYCDKLIENVNGDRDGI